MKKSLFLVLTLVVAAFANAQVEVVKIEKLDATTPLYHPLFDASGSQLLLSSENFDGLKHYDLQTGKISVISNEPNAGLEPVFNADGSKVFFQAANFDANGRKFTSIKTFDLATKTEKKVMEASRNVGKLQSYENGIVLAKEEKLFKATFGKKSSVVPPFVSNEDLKLVLYKNGKRSELHPYKDKDINYVWASLSPDGTKILFNTKYGTAVCDLNGKILANFGNLNAPVWYNNKYIVGMFDEDDGHMFTASTIAIVSLDGTTKQVLTDGKELAMYPTVSPRNNKIAFNTIDGKIYVMTIKF